MRSRFGSSTTTLLLSVSAFVALWAGCGTSNPSPDTPTSEATASATAPAPVDAPKLATDDGRGGRIFDAWYSGKSFKPAKKGADGSGGPFSNGTLKGADGAPFADDKGHQTRLKNLFGWDLRGKDGVYGPKYQAKSYVLDRNLLTVEATREDLVRWFTKGDAGIPAYGDVLDAQEIGALVDFVMSMREGKTAQPEQVFTLAEKSPGNYVLNAGADPARGAKLIAERCSGCHGTNGTKVLFDGGGYSLGAHARQKAYEDWMKILNGQPGTGMQRQVQGATGAEQAKEILDILSALCDRTAFPKGNGTEADVPDGDPRCGSYLR